MDLLQVKIWVLNNPTSVIFSSKDVGDSVDVTATGYTIADKA